MEETQEKEVTCYKIIPNSHLQLSEELFEIEHSSSSSTELQFPIHEEYKLAMARIEFLSFTDAACKKAVEDIRRAKMHKLHMVQRRKLFLQRSQLFLSHLKRRRQALNDKTSKLIAEYRNQLKMLNQEDDMISQDLLEFQKEMEQEFRSYQE